MSWFLSCDKCNYCKSLWTKVSAKCPKCKCECTCNLYKVVLSDHLYPMMKHFYPDGVVSSRMPISTSTGHEGSLNGLSIKIMNHESFYGLCSHQILAHTFGRFWTDVLGSTLHHKT